LNLLGTALTVASGLAAYFIFSRRSARGR
jgi:hypothetical protein